MRPALHSVVRFAALAIEEALARRPDARDADGAFSAERERGELLAGVLAEPGEDGGLRPGGPADLARLALDELLAEHPDDPLSRVDTALRLDAVGRDVLRLVLAWTLEPRLATLVGHLNDALQDVSLRPRVLGEILGDAAGVAVALATSSPLCRERVILADREGPDARLHLDGRLSVFLIDGELPPWRDDEGEAWCVKAPASPPEEADVVRGVDVGVVVLEGAPGGGRRSLAAAIAAREGRPLWLCAPQGSPPAPSALQRAIRDVRLLRARLLYWGELDEVGAHLLARASDVPLALAGPERPHLPGCLLDRSSVTIRLAVPGEKERRAFWARELGDGATSASLARRYALTPGQIARAARQLATRPPEEACRLQLHHELDRLAVEATGGVGWERLVLPARSRAALQAICAQVRNRDLVDGDWGFAEHHAAGHGLKALFHGRPGTGKTLAARVVARELGLPLYAADVSRILSRWIGVAEQRVTELFEQARRAGAILFFDEADSLYSARTPSPSSATEKFTNTLVNQLLTLVENHEGVVLLATNLKSGLDPALMRRLHYVVEFPEPDREARESLWRVCIPPRAPLSETVDLARLAAQHEIAGGAIRNVVTSAAYLAAERSRAISPEDIALALQWEYDKLDRLAPAPAA